MGAATAGGRVGVRRLEYRWLLPALLTQEIDPDEQPDSLGRGRPVPRSARDWVVDAVFFLMAVWAGLGLWLATGFMHADAVPGLRIADLAAGFVTCLSLWWRRRWPVVLTLATTPFAAFSTSEGVAGLILMFTVAVHRRLPITLGVGVIFLLPAFILPLIWTDGSSSYRGSVVFSIVLIVLVTGWGMFVRARRQLILSWRARAALAEAERHRQVADARRAERLRIAREMHDVLGHRLSLLSLHAGALEFRPDAPPEQIAQAAGVVRASAQLAMSELRQVIGVLREDDLGPAAPAGDAADAGRRPASPQPTQPSAGAAERARRPVSAPLALPPAPAPKLTDLPELVDESRRAGVAIRAHYQLSEPHTASTTTAGSAYRIVQEALTNARKHAPGELVHLLIDGSAVSGLHIEVRNRRSGPRPIRAPEPATGPTAAAGGGARPGAAPLGARPAAVAPVAGSGLVGLTERATLAGGALRHEVTPEGEFLLQAWLPWTPDGDSGATNETTTADGKTSAGPGSAGRSLASGAGRVIDAAERGLLRGLIARVG